MQTKLTHVLPVLAAMLLAIGVANAQEESDDQVDVWAVIEQQWNADEKGDKKWVEKLLTDDFAGWGTNSPAPRSRESTKMWDRFNDTQGRSVAHELYPLAIVVRGDVAVAHYLYTSAFEGKDGEVEVNNGRYSDVLVRTDDGWRFLAWHGGDDK
jgi:ketosteroid isomerase-like protein